MSKISPDFIHSVGYLYEEINIQQQDFLNEDSEHYDAEAAELVEDILSTISSTMICEGYSTNGVIGFLADSSEEDILEKYLSYNESMITESVVTEEYIQEQLEIFDQVIAELNLGSVAKLGKGILGLAGRVASKPARMAVASKIMKSANPARTIAAVERLSASKVAKAGLDPAMVKNAPDLASKVRMGVTAPIKGKVSQAVKAVKDLAQKAKPVLKNVAKLGAVGLTAGAGGYLGAKLAGAGSKPSESPKPTQTPPAAPAKPPAAPAKPSSGSPAPASPKPKPQADSGTQQYKDLIKAGKTKEAEALGLKQWAKAHPDLASKLNPDGTQKGTGQSQMEKDAEQLRQMTNASKQRQGELMGGPEGPGKIDTKAADAALKAQQEKDSQKVKKDLEKAASSMKESYEPYDIILEYLMGKGHADTIEEAHYIMLEMDTDAVGAIMQEYQDYVLAEEISEWVNGLINEGYDFSEYSWDDVVEYYVTEAKYGTAKGRKALAKKVRKGEDVGKKGAGFEAIVKKASGKYGKERATKIAAAAMWKNLGGKKGKTQKEW